MPSYRLSKIITESQDFDKQHGQRLNDFEYPTQVGGQSVSLIVGIKNTDVQPDRVHVLPSGMSFSMCMDQD